MNQVQRILCPTDFSLESKSAIDFLTTLTGGRNVELHFVHVLEIPVFIDSYGLMYFDQILQEAKQGSEKKMNALVEEMRQAHPNDAIYSDIIDGQDSAEALIEYAGKKNIDFILLSSHGRKGWKRLLMGSVAESLMRLSPVPVVVYRNHEDSKVPKEH